MRCRVNASRHSTTTNNGTKLEPLIGRSLYGVLCVVYEPRTLYPFNAGINSPNALWRYCAVFLCVCVSVCTKLRKRFRVTSRQHPSVSACIHAFESKGMTCLGLNGYLTQLKTKNYLRFSVANRMQSGSRYHRKTNFCVCVIVSISFLRHTWLVCGWVGMNFSSNFGFNVWSM